MRLRPLGRAEGPARKDLLRTWSFVWIWLLPAALIIFASNAYLAKFLSFDEAGVILTASTAWIGIGCFINARRCGRTHCTIDGYLLPLLSVAGLLNLAGVIAIGWKLYVSFLTGIVVISLVPECCGAMYLRRGPRSAR
jgi:hypothetical protein